MKRPINFRESNAPLICCKSCFYGKATEVKSIQPDHKLECKLTNRLLKPSNLCDQWKKKTTRTASGEIDVIKANQQTAKTARPKNVDDDIPLFIWTGGERTPSRARFRRLPYLQQVNNRFHHARGRSPDSGDRTHGVGNLQSDWLAKIQQKSVWIFWHFKIVSGPNTGT